jgi:hypothetical protein
MFRMSILEAQVHANQQMERLGCLCTHAAAGTNVYAAKTNDEIWMSVSLCRLRVSTCCLPGTQISPRQQALPAIIPLCGWYTVGLPVDPFTVHIRCLASDICLKGPFHNSRPIKIPLVVSHLILRFFRFSYSPTSGIRGRCTCGASQSLSSNKTMPEIREVAGWVERFPPCINIMLVQVIEDNQVVLKIVVIVVAVRSLEEAIEAQSLRSGAILHGSVEKVRKPCYADPASTQRNVSQS